MDFSTTNARLSLLLGLGLSIPLLFKAKGLIHRLRRSSQVPANYERVLILGASSGIGRSIAHLYAARGARVCVVSRREIELQSVMDECNALSIKAGHAEYQAGGKRIISVAGDFTEVDDMVNVRNIVEMEWRGLDTLIVCAGVSALQPLLSIAGVERVGKTFIPSQANTEDIKRTVDVAQRATAGNYVGPLVVAVTFMPILSTTSPQPSILLLSSLAAVIPAPTRSLYGSTKAGSLMLYQSLAIEHPDISFSFILPSTVEGNFRASAVDDVKIHEEDPQTHGLKREVVARRCVQAVDQGDRVVFLPRIYTYAQIVYWLMPKFVEWRARVKYNFGLENPPTSATTNSTSTRQ